MIIETGTLTNRIYNKMTKEQFINRLKEVGFEITSPYSAHKNYFAIGISKNKNMFIDTYENNIYSFDELDQFLEDKGIVEPKFDADEYFKSLGYQLVTTGCVNTWQINSYYITLPYKKDYLIVEGQHNISCKAETDSSWCFEGITKESCDKAIGLIKYLESIE